MTATVQLNKPVLKIGSQGASVRELQTLICNFFRSPVLEIDGIFGVQTEAMVKEMQERFFLTVDGVVGNQTWKALIARQPVDMPSLRRGSQGDLVRRVQQRLEINGYQPGAIDGIFGGNTEAAVKRFQADKRYFSAGNVDGVIGAKTWRGLSLLPPYVNC